jgi:NhaP-type Na+/H+ or K+/H+ antiporter
VRLADLKAKREGTWRRTSVLALGGGLGFWMANFAISLTPIAAEYRAALSISYLPMLLEALLGGLIIGFFVGYSLLRFFDKLPTKDPILNALVLSFIAFVIVTLLIEVPAKSLATTSDPLRYFLIAALFNVLRILALGVVVGYLYGRLYGRARRPRLHDGRKGRDAYQHHS